MAGGNLLPARRVLVGERPPSKKEILMTLTRALPRTALPVLAVTVVAAAIGLGVPGPAVAAAPLSAHAVSAQQSGPACCASATGDWSSASGRT